MTVTLPGARYGILSAAIAVFTLAICDFGVAKVLGGQFNVLATDIYRQVVGMHNFALGAVASIMLLLPALFSFVIEHRVRRRMQEQASTRALPAQASRRQGLAGIFMVSAMRIAGHRHHRHGDLRLAHPLLAL